MVNEDEIRLSGEGFDIGDIFQNFGGTDNPGNDGGNADNSNDGNTGQDNSGDTGGNNTTNGNTGNEGNNAADNGSTDTNAPDNTNNGNTNSNENTNTNDTNNGNANDNANSNENTNVNNGNNDNNGNTPAPPNNNDSNDTNTNTGGNNGNGGGGMVGREVSPDDGSETAEDATENTGAEGAGEDATEETTSEEHPGFVKDQGKTGDAGTQQPWGGVELEIGNGWLIGGLVLILALLLCLAAEYFRRNRKKKVRRSPRPAPVAYAGGGAVSAAVYQHIGAREDQQDSYGVSRPELYAQQGVMGVVADGMGGLSNGKAVSSALVRTFLDGFPQVSAYYSLTSDILLDLSIRANAQINQMLRGAERSGSTLVATLIRDGYLHFLTVGDSRIYLYRGGALLQLNREHIYQEELAAKAVNQAVTMNQVRSDRQAHSLTSYFGIGRIPSIDRNDEGIKLVNGDRILLASDGVFGTLSREQMEQALQLNNINDAAKQMGDWILAEDKPYQDNNTLVILEYRG